jgi:hypothetical protein
MEKHEAASIFVSKMKQDFAAKIETDPDCANGIISLRQGPLRMEWTDEESAIAMLEHHGFDRLEATALKTPAKIRSQFPQVWNAIAENFVEITRGPSTVALKKSAKEND